jgi:hypothetical protein
MSWTARDLFADWCPASVLSITHSQHDACVDRNGLITLESRSHNPSTLEHFAPLLVVFSQYPWVMLLATCVCSVGYLPSMHGLIQVWTGHDFLVCVRIFLGVTLQLWRGRHFWTKSQPIQLVHFWILFLRICSHCFLSWGVRVLCQIKCLLFLLETPVLNYRRTVKSTIVAILWLT